MASSCVRGVLDWILGKISLLSGQTLEQTAQGSGGVTIPGGIQKTSKTGHVGTWFSQRGGVRLTVGLDDLRGLFQPTIL